MTLVMRKVVRIDRSPMNPKVWCVELDCGHELWRSPKPRAKELNCGECAAQEQGKKNPA